MKLRIKPAGLARTMAFIAIHSALLSNAFPQGSLTPPGAPGPMMKTLAQIEPRTPISSVPFTISQSGSYYLTNNVTVNTGDAIIITANGVSLDLNGFTISSGAAAAIGTGILINAGRRMWRFRMASSRAGWTNNGGILLGSGVFQRDWLQ
jgi:hypothetical protein